MSRIIGKLQSSDNATDYKTLTDNSIVRQYGAKTFYRAAGLIDMTGAHVYEKDVVQIYDKNGNVWIEGVVLYSSRRAAFVLANRFTGDTNEKTLGELIDGRYFQVIE